MCGETRVRVGFGPHHQGPRNSSLFLHIQNPQGVVQTLGFVQIKSSPQLQLRVLRLCPTTRPRRHRTPPLINKAFLLYSQYPDCNLNFLLVLHLLAGNRSSWSDLSFSGVVNNPRKLVQRLLRRDVSHVRSRIVKVDSHRKRQPPSHRNIGTPQPLSQKRSENTIASM